MKLSHIFVPETLQEVSTGYIEYYLPPQSSLHVFDLLIEEGHLLGHGHSETALDSNRSDKCLGHLSSASEVRTHLASS